MFAWFTRNLSRSEPERRSTAQCSLNVIVDPENPQVDLVAVHGLNPFNGANRAESTWMTEGKLWLRDEEFLPRRLPHARVLLFEYNSNVAFGTSAAGLIEQADVLINRLAAKRATDPDRPLIFVCHSLGGLVVKRALIATTGDPNYAEICRATYGVVFFGTPHRGGNGATFGAAIATIIRSFLGSPSNSFMEALKSESALLNNLTVDFRQFLERLYFINFFETLPLRKIRNLVVDRASATLGLDPAREKQIGLEADHCRICKFACPDDPTYQQVENNIADMVKSAVNKRAAASMFDVAPRVLLGNLSRVTGEGNVMIQIGKAHQGVISGASNETCQFGEGNNSNTNGSNNKITQICLDNYRSGESLVWQRWWHWIV